MTAEKASAYRTLHHVLVRVAQLLAPVTPFVADRIYRTLIGAEADGLPSSVHLTGFPEPHPGLVRPDLDAAVAFVRRAVTLGLAVRNAAGVRVRQPLARAVVWAPAPMLEELDLVHELSHRPLAPEALREGEIQHDGPSPPSRRAGTPRRRERPGAPPSGDGRRAPPPPR